MQIHGIQVDGFVESYLEACLFAETDGEQPLDALYSVADFSPEALAMAKRECDSFQIDNAKLIEDSDVADEQIAHNLWLTRNGHGAGFWDGDYPEEIGEALTERAHALGECSVYVGDDDKLHFLGE